MGCSLAEGNCVAASCAGERQNAAVCIRMLELPSLFTEGVRLCGEDHIFQ